MIRTAERLKAHTSNGSSYHSYHVKKLLKCVLYNHTAFITSSPRAVKLSWQHGNVNKMTNKPSKLRQTELVLVCDQSSSVGLCTQDYKSLCVTIMICATLVNTQTDHVF